jgi:hypothetical protein
MQHMLNFPNGIIPPEILHQQAEQAGQAAEEAVAAASPDDGAATDDSGGQCLDDFEQ